MQKDWNFVWLSVRKTKQTLIYIHVETGFLNTFVTDQNPEGRRVFTKEVYYLVSALWHQDFLVSVFKRTLIKKSCKTAMGTCAVLSSYQGIILQRYFPLFQRNELFFLLIGILKMIQIPLIFSKKL